MGGAAALEPLAPTRRQEGSLARTRTVAAGKEAATRSARDLRTPVKTGRTKWEPNTALDGAITIMTSRRRLAVHDESQRESRGSNAVRGDGSAGRPVRRDPGLR